MPRTGTVRSKIERKIRSRKQQRREYATLTTVALQHAQKIQELITDGLKQIPQLTTTGAVYNDHSNGLQQMGQCHHAEFQAMQTFQAVENPKLFQTVTPVSWAAPQVDPQLESINRATINPINLNMISPQLPKMVMDCDSTMHPTFVAAMALDSNMLPQPSNPVPSTSNVPKMIPPHMVPWSTGNMRFHRDNSHTSSHFVVSEQANCQPNAMWHLEKSIYLSDPNVNCLTSAPGECSPGSRETHAKCTITSKDQVDGLPIRSKINAEIALISTEIHSLQLTLNQESPDRKRASDHATAEGFHKPAENSGNNRDVANASHLRRTCSLSCLRKLCCGS
ncbi:hypothetical protein BV898_00373 [Hypsibius exemplaris]|uniref:Uncharacterized protein n=1 Tax=Hypsibius exemplaris TaxID=2072580 RepID=A0A1W0XFR5_HYPEX|nr:hypothetical protein BV898_00373 [Hypsibius exemplaris]